ncbi:MAG: phosphoribosylamine--glycine ligase [Bacteroidetes bacterium]|nr:MAG: phosphoribosylamine--glycine ligase [Bacteroidota bacterium]
MNILILGSGGREHAFAWKIAQSPLCTKLFVAKGNAGTATVAENVDLDVLNFSLIADFVLQNHINLVLVGTETPIVEGIADFFAQNQTLKNVKIIAPSKEGAKLEGSKDFAKIFMQKYQIPTASYQTFDENNLAQGIEYLSTHSTPIVLKADGLAAGKGVIILEDRKEAQQTLTEMIVGKKFGQASTKVVIEQFLKGIELSVFVLTDGKNYVLLPSAKDYKRIGEQDTGLNTGGMGAVSPVPFADEIFMKKVENQIILPTLKGLQTEKIPYIGFIFFGLIKVDDAPFVIEYNIRMGDPESEVVIPRIESDFVELLDLAAQQRLSEAKIKISEQFATTVMLVSKGYPEEYEKGKIIKNLDQVQNAIPFQAGTKKVGDQVLTDGGRVISVTALGESLQKALEKSYLAAKTIDFEGKYFRNDIGQDLM